MSNNTSSRKRKRTLNTTKEQYEMYLSVTESDYAFRSGTVNPTLGENYLKNKWEELTNKLNAIGGGPKLTPEEWKKRFTDWKYATKQKYRKMYEHRIGTGSGPESGIVLTDLEERALSVWGKVTVTGNTCITNYEGIECSVNITDNTACSNQIENTINTCISDTDYVLPDNIAIDYVDNFEETDINKLINPVEEKEKNNANFKESCKLNTPNKNYPKTKPFSVNRPKPLSVLTEKLLESNTQNTNVMKEFQTTLNNFTENYIKLKYDELQWKKTELRFQVAKMKLKYPGFDFDI